MSPQMRTVLESCAVAAKSGDARDKYFAVAVGSFDPAAGAQLRSELPGLEAADAALAAAVTELAEIVPDAHACEKKGVAFSKKGKSREGFSRRRFGAAELAEQKALFDEAKQTILSPDASCKNKFVEMSTSLFGPRWHNAGKILELVFEEALSPEDSTASFLEKAHAEV